MRRFFLLLPLLAASSLFAEEIRREPLILKQGGTAEHPAVFDGKGMMIDLGIDVSDHPWIKDGEVWTSSGPLLGRASLAAGQLAGLFIDEVPLSIPRDVPTEKLHPERKEHCYFPAAALKPGQMGYAEDGSIYFRWPAGKQPGQARLILPSKPNISCVSIQCSHIIVRNLTVMHAANDGFNLHGKFIGVRLENVHALSNADEGISAHDDTELTVDGAEIAWNGSAAGGVADVNACTSSYSHCQVYNNLGAAFFFSGKAHRVVDTLIYNQSRDFAISAPSQVKHERIEWRK
jgi:hypothetical protein